MTQTISPCLSPVLASRLFALAERRCAYFVDLHASGRWRHYYTRDELVSHMRGAIEQSQYWQRLAGEMAASLPAHRQPNVPVDFVPAEASAA